MLLCPCSVHGWKGNWSMALNPIAKSEAEAGRLPGSPTTMVCPFWSRPTGPSYGALTTPSTGPGARSRSGNTATSARARSPWHGLGAQAEAAAKAKSVADEWLAARKIGNSPKTYARDARSVRLKDGYRTGKEFADVPVELVETRASVGPRRAVQQADANSRGLGRAARSWRSPSARG